MSAVDRLRLDTLERATADAVPGYDPRQVQVGIVHLGVGAFFRAHQAVYADDVLASGDLRWGICGFSQRSRRVPDQLEPQDGLYSVLIRDAGTAPRARVVGALRELGCAADEPERVVARIAAATTHVVTLTVTEKGYRYDAAAGGLRADEDVAADLAGRPPRTVVGQLVRGLQRRRREHGAAIALVSCDNLTSNGALLRGLVHDFVARLPAEEQAELEGYLDETVAFPSTMVDRIVPATTDADREEASRLLGLRDEGVVVAEPFAQWVIEDAFTGPRPAWEQAGATLTDDVEAYERVKLRLLNAAHSLLAYLGVLAGYETIAEAVGDEAIGAAARRLLDEDQIPTVAPPDDIDLAAYRDEVLRRFSNPALGHRTTQVAMDGSQKLPQRLLGAVRQRRAEGALPGQGALLIAAWMRAIAGRRADGSAFEIEDPMREVVRERLAEAADAHAAAEGVLRLESIFGRHLVDDDALVAAVAEAYEGLEDGVHRALQRREG